MAESEPLDELLQAFVAKWNSHIGSGGTLEGLGRAYRDEKPATSTGSFRHGVIKTNRSVPASPAYTCSRTLWRSEIIIEIHRDTPENCATDAGAVLTIFNSDSLSLSLGNGHTLVRHRFKGAEYKSTDEQRNSVSLPFEFVTSKPRLA